MTTNIWKRQYSDPSNLDPFSGENHETYRSVTGFNISLFKGTLHVGKTHVWFKIANTRHALPFHASSLQTDLAPKRVVVSRLRQLLHDTVARFRTGRGELSRGDSRRHDILWWYHVNKYRAMRGNRSELAPGRKSPRCHVNTHIASS